MERTEKEYEFFMCRNGSENLKKGQTGTRWLSAALFLQLQAVDVNVHAGMCSLYNCVSSSTLHLN